MSTEQLPEGELTIRTIAMPKDTNANGDIFGGWLVSQMDIGAAILAKQICHSRITTVAIEKMTFIKPVNVGDIVCCYAELQKVGNTSLHIKMQVWIIPHDKTIRQKVAEGTFVFVAIDENGRPKPVHAK